MNKHNNNEIIQGLCIGTKFPYKSNEANVFHAINGCGIMKMLFFVDFTFVKQSYIVFTVNYDAENVNVDFLCCYRTIKVLILSCDWSFYEILILQSTYLHLFESMLSINLFDYLFLVFILLICQQFIL